MTQSREKQTTRTGNICTVVLSGEITIDRPPQEVWPALFEYNRWNPDHIGAKVERIAGESHQEGEIILEHKKSGEGYLPPLMIETVKIIANRKLVWKLSSPNGTDDGVGIVDFSLRENNDGTLFLYNCYSLAPATEDSNEVQMTQESAQPVIKTFMRELKKYTENNQQH